MMVYRLALLFACIGVVSGVIGTIMEDSGGDNWFDQSVQNVETIVITDGEVESLQFDGGSGILEDLDLLFKTANMLWNMLKGVFFIIGFLLTFMVYDVGTGNLFEPILYAFQVLIYLIYIIGAIQYLSNRSIKVME